GYPVTPRFSSPLPLSGGLPRAKSVTNRDSIAHGSSGTEFLVVVDQIQMGLRPDKETLGRIYLHPHSKMSHEMVDGDVVLAVIEIAGLERLVMGGGFRSETRQELHVSTVCKLGRVDRVKVVKERAIRLHSLPDTTTRLPGKFALKTYVPEQDHVAA